MTGGLEKKTTEHVVHELRHVLLALEATRKTLSRGTKETDVMIRLQTQSIDRIQGIIEYYRTLGGEDASESRKPSPNKEFHA